MAPNQSIHEAARDGKTDELKRLLKDNPGDLESKNVSCASPLSLPRLLLLRPPPAADRAPLAPPHPHPRRWRTLGAASPAPLRCRRPRLPPPLWPAHRRSTRLPSLPPLSRHRRLAGHH